MSKGPRQGRLRNGWSFALVATLSVMLLATPYAYAAGSDATALERAPIPGARVIASTTDALTIEYLLPPVSIGEIEAEGQRFVQVRAEGLETTADPGRPALPAVGLWIGLPPEGSVDVEILESEVRTLSLPAPVLPVASTVAPDPAPEGLVPVEALQTRLAPDPEVYQADALYPGTLARLEQEGWIRSQRVGLLRLHPVQFNPRRGELVIHDRLLVRVRFASCHRTGGINEPAPFEALFQTALLNAQQARQWRTPRMPQMEGVGGAFPIDARFVEVLVDHDGLYRIAGHELQDLGVPLEAVDPRGLHLLLNGVEVPLWIPGEDDGILEPEEAIYFYGERPRSRYSRTSAYRLLWDSTPGLRLPLVAAQPGATPPAPALLATARAEENHLYVSQLADLPGHDPWFWTYLYTPSAPERTFLLALQQVAASQPQATLRIALRSTLATGLNPDHHVQVYLNDVLLGDGWWNDRDPFVLEVSAPQQILFEGTNTIRLVAPGDTGYSYDLFYVDWIELSYAQTSTVSGERTEFGLPEGGPWTVSLEPFSDPEVVALAIKDPRLPMLLSGETEPVAAGFRFRFESLPGSNVRYHVLSLAQADSPVALSWRKAPNLLQPRGADYIAIAPAAFLEAIQPLLDAYKADGLRTAAVDIQEIYDTFSYGQPNPEAIRDFLSYAYAHWEPPAPTYVLLVGDGHYDFRNDLGFGAPNWIPPYLAYVDPWIGEALADNRYVSIIGDDPLADMILGRLPANTPEEVAAVVQKVLALRAQANPEPWHSQVLFIADNPDGSGNFPALSDHIANNHLSQPYAADKVYLGVNYPYQNPALAARQAIRQAINDGRLLVNYIGHAGVSILAAEQMFRASDISELNNAPRFPVLLLWACYAARYGEPDPSNAAIAEVAVRAGEKGAVAAWGSTGLGLFWTHQYMNEGVFDALFQEGIRDLGTALLAGNLRLYAAAPSMAFELEEFVLLGDPATRVPLLPANLGFNDAWAVPNPVSQMSVVTVTLGLKNQGPAPAHDVRLRLLIPEAWGLLSYQALGIEATLISPDPPVWGIQDLSASEGGQLVVTLRSGPQGWQPLTAFLETSTPESTLEDNRVALDIWVLPPPAAYITLKAEPESISPGAEALVRIAVVDSLGRPVPDGTIVALRASAGSFRSATAVTRDGFAEAAYRAPARPGSVTLTASVGSARAELLLLIASAPTRTQPGSLAQR